MAANANGQNTNANGRMNTSGTEQNNMIVNDPEDNGYDTEVDDPINQNDEGPVGGRRSHRRKRASHRKSHHVRKSHHTRKSHHKRKSHRKSHHRKSHHKRKTHHKRK